METKQVNTRIPLDLLDEIKRQAAKERRALTEVILEALRQYLRRQKRLNNRR